MNNWDAVSAIANVLMAFASIFGLLFIYLQLRALASHEKLQNDALKLNHYSEYTKRYQDILLNLPSNIGSSQFVFSKLRGSAKERILQYMRAYFDLCYEEWDLHNRGLIEASSWQVWEDGMSKALRRPAFREAWLLLAGSDSEYGSEFTSFVEKIQA